MSKPKRSPRRRKAQHKANRQRSRHDKRSRLNQRNPRRKKTRRARFPLVGTMQRAIKSLQAILDRRIAFRLAIIVSGMFFAEGRRTASSWFAAAGVRDDWDQFYDCLIRIGQRAGQFSFSVLALLVRKFAPGPGERVVVAVDDSPTRRYGPRVEGAGVHHDPTPGPAGGEWLYGHVWVSLAWLRQHPLWGTIALPLRSLLYVRKVDVPKLDQQRGWEFRTKHQLAAELVQWFASSMQSLGSQAKIWVVADGAYAARPFLDPLRRAGMVVFSRLRKDARLWDLPPARRPGQRGRPRIYGYHKISLAKRAGQKRGWLPITYWCRGAEMTKQYKTFEATSRLVGGRLRVVLVRDERHWVAYFCSDAAADVTGVLETAATRWSIEEQFHDVKEVWGAGQQQVRNVWSNIACWNLNQWMYSLVEMCAWDEPQATLTDRSGRPWDNPDRRPSHADRRRWLAREFLDQELHALLPEMPDPQQFRRLAESLLGICV